MSLCRECKQPASRGRQYCSELCSRMHAQRAYKARAGLTSPRHCRLRRDMLNYCKLCSAYNELPGCMVTCANWHTARRCALGRCVRYHGFARERHIVAADCRECAHIA